MKKIITLLFTITLCISCTKDEEEFGGCGCTYINTSFQLSLVNEKGDDLLDPNNPKKIDLTKMDLIKVVNTTETVYYSGYHITPYPYQGKYWISIPLYADPNEEISITKVKWSKDDTDYFSAKFSFSNGIVWQKIWHNNNLIFDRSSPLQDEALLVLVK